MQPKKPYHHGNLRRALIESAVALIAQLGPESFTLREVARDAGVTHNAPYRHFVSKEELLATIATQGYQELFRVLKKAADQRRDALDGIKMAGTAYVKFALKVPAIYSVMFDRNYAVGIYPDLDKAITATHSILIELVDACRTEGLMTRGSVRENAYLCWSIVHGIAKLSVSERMNFTSKAEQKRFVQFSITSALGRWPSI